MDALLDYWNELLTSKNAEDKELPGATYSTFGAWMGFPQADFVKLTGHDIAIVHS